MRTAVRQCIAEGHQVAHAHLRYLNPFPKNLGDLISRYKKVLVPELNCGQLRFVLRGPIWSMRWASIKFRGNRSSFTNLSNKSTPCWKVIPNDDRTTRPHSQRFRERPGNSLVPQVRGLFDPRPNEKSPAHLGYPQGRFRVRVGHRLLQPVPVLHGHLRVPRHPRPGPGDCHRRQTGPARFAGVGYHRRRRCPVHRRQPPDARHPAERQPQNRAVQQPDLRADQRPILAHQPLGFPHEKHALRLGR